MFLVPYVILMVSYSKLIMEINLASVLFMLNFYLYSFFTSSEAASALHHYLLCHLHCFIVFVYHYKHDLFKINNMQSIS